MTGPSKTSTPSVRRQLRVLQEIRVVVIEDALEVLQVEPRIARQREIEADDVVGGVLRHHAFGLAQARDIDLAPRGVIQSTPERIFEVYTKPDLIP